MEEVISSFLASSIEQVGVCVSLGHVTMRCTFPHVSAWGCHVLNPSPVTPGYAEIKTILGRTLVFHVTFPIGRGLLCRGGLAPIRAAAFAILKLAGSSIRLPGPLPRRFPRTIFVDRCFMRSFDWPVVCLSIFVKPSIIPLVGSGSRHFVSLLIDNLLCLVPIRVRTRRCGKCVARVYWSP